MTTFIGRGGGLVCANCGQLFEAHTSSLRTCPSVDKFDQPAGVPPPQFDSTAVKVTLLALHIKLGFATAIRQARPDLPPHAVMNRAWEDADAFLKKYGE